MTYRSLSQEETDGLGVCEREVSCELEASFLLGWGLSYYLILRVSM